jgi:alpha-tubulin suppressor-like RCC1 family protein
MSCGLNSVGQCGLEYPEIIATPTLVSELTDKEIDLIAVGRDHNAFLSVKQNAVYMCGSNCSHQCGFIENDKIFKPKRIQLDSFNNEKLKLVACGGIAFTMFVTKSSSGEGDNLYFTGSSVFGVKGDEREVISRDKVPTLVNSSALRGKTIEYISCGSYHAVLKTSDNEFYGSGYQGNGELGLGHSTSMSTFTKLKLPNLVKVVCGYYHTVFVNKDNKYFICGSNSDNGLCVNIRDAAALSPIEVTKHLPEQCNSGTDPDYIVDIFCGGYHRAFITIKNNYVLGGHNAYNQCTAWRNEEKRSYQLVNVFGKDFKLSPYQKLMFSGGSNFSIFYIANYLTAETSLFYTELYKRLLQCQLSDVHIITQH